MSFTDFDFLFRFLPVFLLVYYLAPPKARIWVLITGSLFFYGLAGPLFVVLLFLLSVWNHLLGKGARRGERSALLCGAAVDVLALALAKMLGALQGPAFLPVGMSFYIFRMISYLADSFRGKMKEEPTFAASLAYFCLFPQLLSGPIMRYEDYGKISAFRDSAPDAGWKTEIRNIFVRVENGLTWFIPGLACKVLLADHLRTLWNALYGIGYESISTPLAWLGVFTYSMELYFDFWGYSLMAAGIGVMIGLPMIENFTQPYAAGSVSEFYRRWHVTLGTFFRDYVYIPLGGSRGSTAVTVRNLALVWLLTGIWHGVGWNYLIWAGALFVMILVERALRKGPQKAAAVIGRIHVWVMIPLTWVVFAIPDPERLRTYFLRLFPVADPGGAVFAGDFVKYLTAYGPVLALSLVFLIPSVYHGFVRHRRSPAAALILAGLFAASLISLRRAGANPFLYLQF
ncbi:MAG: MBOAT family protein [Lachnospiraceae bacterium]|nr:MBOAT family protein [Lachnospiraceae bacterium]